MSKFRTDSLFHYTKKFETLLTILKEGLKPNYCKEDFSYDIHIEDDKEEQLAEIVAPMKITKENSVIKKRKIYYIPMVSFCDIPLSKTSLFTERYGEYAIGLKKVWANNYDYINPVLYVRENKILQALDFFNEEFYNKAEEIFKNYAKEYTQEYISNNPSKEIDPETVTNKIIQSNKAEESLNNSIELKRFNIALCSIAGFVKKFKIERNETNVITYEENEWRYIIEEDEEIGWLNEKEYNEEKNNPDKDLKNKLENKKLEFSIDDINFIIVKEEKEVEQLIKEISKPENKINNSDKNKLYTKIISFEKIRNNF